MKKATCYVTSLAAAAMLFAVTGCQSVSTTTTQSIGVPTFPPTDPATVQILRTEPTRPNIRLGEIHAEPYSESTPAVKIEEALQKAAAKLGANAAVVVYDKTQVVGAMVTGPWYGRSIENITGRVVVAVAIRYTGP